MPARHQRPPRREKEGRQGQAQAQSFFPLPADARACLARISQCQNPGLWLDHYIEWEKRNGELKRTSRSDRREHIPKTFKGALKDLLSAYHQRWKAMLENYERRGFKVERFSMQAKSRVVVGLGAESVLETSIRLHAVHGFPILPGSSLKGLARAWAELKEGKRESDVDFVAVFGSSPPDARAGKILFLDAIPTDPDNLGLELDVMNPHYSAYYQGDEFPADYLNPIPIFFLTIKPGSRFNFGLVCRDTRLAAEEQEKILGLAGEWLQKGLREMGIGAKTSAGYGLWEDDDQGQEAIGASALEAQKPQPAAPEPLTQVSPDTPRIPAQVVDNSRKPIRVRLLVKGYEEDILECGGVANLEAFPVGTYIWVQVSQFDRKTRRVQSVRLVGLWQP